MIKAPPCLGELEQECSLQDQRVAIFVVLSLLLMGVLRVERAIRLEHHMNSFVFSSFQLVSKDFIISNHLLGRFMLMEWHTFLLKPKHFYSLYPTDTFGSKSFVVDFNEMMA